MIRRNNCRRWKTSRFFRRTQRRHSDSESARLLHAAVVVMIVLVAPDLCIQYTHIHTYVYANNISTIVEMWRTFLNETIVLSKIGKMTTVTIWLQYSRYWQFTMFSKRKKNDTICARNDFETIDDCCIIHTACASCTSILIDDGNNCVIIPTRTQSSFVQFS